MLSFPSAFPLDLCQGLLNAPRLLHDCAWGGSWCWSGLLDAELAAGVHAAVVPDVGASVSSRADENHRPRHAVRCAGPSVSGVPQSVLQHHAQGARSPAEIVQDSVDLLAKTAGIKWSVLSESRAAL